MSDNDKKDEPKVQADNNSIAIGNISASGNIGNITIGNTTGYSVEEVSVLLTQITTIFQPKPFDGHCPYKGLDVFEEEDAELFFGRERLVDDLISRVKDSRTVFVTGPSGSGKSSLVRAGLIYALKQGAIKNSKRWLYTTMKPGRDPLGELARVTAGLADSTNAEDEIRARALTDATIFARWCEIALKDRRDKHAVLFIDQFEEVFTQISKEAERAAFLNLLTRAATVENGRVIILFSMRSDFVSNCATYPQLNALLNQQFVQIGAMQPEELVSAIAQPALRVGLRIDPDLIAQIINDMQGEPGALPLMQFALKDLFDSQEAKGTIALTLNDYLQRGGIHKALERHADASFAKLDRNEKELAHYIFSGLIEVGRGTQDTRRTAIFDELIPTNTNTEDIRTVIEKLTDARLITTDEQAGKDTITISHERLIDAWPWLKKLVNENRDVIALQNEIASNAKEWDEHHHDASYLYTGARLASAREKLDTNKIVLNGLSQFFIETGVTVYTDELEVAKERATQLRKRSVYLTIALVAALVAVIIAVLFGIDAKQQTNISRVRELAAQSVALRSRNFSVALLLGVEAFKTRDTAQTRGALMDNMYAYPQLQTYLIRHTDLVTSVAFSPDGKTLASGSLDNTIILWNVETRQPIGQPLRGHASYVYSVAFSPDGKTLASGSWDATIILWNVETRQAIGQPLRGHTDLVRSVAFSPDGKTLASGSGDNTIILWNVETRQPIGQPLRGHASYVDSVAFSPDGKTLASGSNDNTIILWNVETRQAIGQPLRGHTDLVRSVAFSPNGKMLASGSMDNTITLWDIETRRPIGQLLTGYLYYPYSVAFSPDGQMLASGSGNGTIILWDVGTRQPIGQPLQGHTSYVFSVAFSPNGKTLASGSADNTIILWNVETRQPITQQLQEHTAVVTSIAFSPDGKTLASGSADNTIILWNVETRQPIDDQPLRGHASYVLCVAFSPDGKTLASGSQDGTIILWDVETRQPIDQPLGEHANVVTSVAFSPDGKTLASGSWDNTIILWNVETRQPIGQPLQGHASYVYSVAFSPDGKTLASASGDTTIILWNVETRQAIGQPLRGHTDLVRSVAFSPNGKILASASWDGILILWDVKTRQPIGQPLREHTSIIYSVAFSPNGKMLASGSGDNTIILWDVGTRQPIGQPLRGHIAHIYSVAFSPNGKMLASGSYDNTIILWDVYPLSWIQKTCKRVGRNLTQVEWERYLPYKKYQITCQQWPEKPEVTLTP